MLSTVSSWPSVRLASGTNANLQTTKADEDVLRCFLQLKREEHELVQSSEVGVNRPRLSLQPFVCVKVEGFSSTPCLAAVSNIS